MSLFTCFSDLFSSGSGASSFGGDDGFQHGLDDFSINPANGNPMVGGIGGLDVAGNPFGTDSSHDHMTSSTFDDSWLSSSGGNFSDW
ncbi:MAG: hypothetical protein ACYC4A_06025 [Desulfobulbia bacterium]